MSCFRRPVVIFHSYWWTMHSTSQPSPPHTPVRGGWGWEQGIPSRKAVVAAAVGGRRWGVRTSSPSHVSWLDVGLDVSRRQVVWVMGWWRPRLATKRVVGVGVMWVAPTVAAATANASRRQRQVGRQFLFHGAEHGLAAPRSRLHGSARSTMGHP